MTFGFVGLSKLANLLFTRELQKRFDSTGIAAVTVAIHPGGVRTGEPTTPLESVDFKADCPTAGSINFATELGNIGILDNSLTAIEGALTPLFGAAHPVVWKERSAYGGAYLMPFGVIEEPSEDAQNADLAKELWATSEQVIQSVLETND